MALSSSAANDRSMISSGTCARYHTLAAAKQLDAVMCDVIVVITSIDKRSRVIIGINVIFFVIITIIAAAMGVITYRVLRRTPYYEVRAVHDGGVHLDAKLGV